MKASRATRSPRAAPSGAGARLLLKTRRRASASRAARNGGLPDPPPTPAMCTSPPERTPRPTRRQVGAARLRARVGKGSARHARHVTPQTPSSRCRCPGPPPPSTPTSRAASSKVSRAARHKSQRALLKLPTNARSLRRFAHELADEPIVPRRVDAGKMPLGFIRRSGPRGNGPTANDDA